MKTVLGIESGGSKALACLADFNGNILATAAAPSIADVVPNPQWEAAGLKRLLDELEKECGALDVAAVYVSLGGLNQESVIGNLRSFFPEVPIDAHRESDGDLVLSCAPWWGFEIAVMAGTGTVALGRNAAGRRLKAGGWGSWIDDAGSGFYIGQRGIRDAVRFLDLEAEETVLFAELAQEDIFSAGTLGRFAPGELRNLDFQREHREEILEAVKMAYPQMNRRSVAACCPAVVRAAAAGDSVAVAILRDAGRELAEIAAGLARRLQLEKPLAIGMGGILTNIPIVFQSFTEQLRTLLPGARTDASDFTLATGSVLRALELAGVCLSEECVQNVRKTKV